MYTLVSVLIIIAAILLVLIVLVQNSKGGGLAANFASSNQNFGARQTSDFLEKATWTLITAIFVLCLTATALIPDSSVRQGRSAVQDGIQNVVDPTVRPTFPDAGMPAAGEEQPVINEDTSSSAE